MAVAPEATRAEAAEASQTAEQLFQEHAGWIYGYCLRLLRSPEEAEDALQTTYLNACRSLQGGTRPQVGSAWLLRIAQNVCFARLRSSGRRGRLERVQDTTFLEETVAAPERSPDELIGLTDALCSIPERQREAILLREWQGLSYNEVGDRLGLSQAAVETLIFRARRSLAAALEDPGKRGRRRVLRALDLGGLAAALKGLFAGGAGVKTVAAITVAAATTATVVATDPAGVWRDRHDRPASSTAPAQASPERHARGPAFRLLPTPATTVTAPSETVLLPDSGQAGKPGPDSERGRAFGQATAAAAKEKAGNRGGNGKGKALGLAKNDSAGQANGNSNGDGAGSPGAGNPDRATQGQGRTDPPGKATAKGQAKKAATNSSR